MGKAGEGKKEGEEKISEKINLGLWSAGGEKEGFSKAALTA